MMTVWDILGKYDLRFDKHGHSYLMFSIGELRSMPNVDISILDGINLDPSKKFKVHIDAALKVGIITDSEAKLLRWVE